jgi:serine/threonine protein kinase
MGDVHEVKVGGLNLAHKRMLFRRKIGERERREIEILKKLSHSHVVQVVGTYTQNRFLGILMYPVAVCDLYTFFEDVEAWTDLVLQHPQSVALASLDTSSKERLDALEYDYPTDPSKGLMAIPIFVQIGCLLSAVAYLHGQKIRHKDLKPFNILLSRNKIWISDFGSATDFSLLSQSGTDNERGTPRYFAPEYIIPYSLVLTNRLTNMRRMAEKKKCGRSADIFSLGCVLLEIIMVQRCGTLEHVRLNRSDDPCFHANLDRINGWLRQSKQRVSSTRDNFLNCEVKRMLAAKPSDRPTISELLASFSAADMATTQLDGFISIFGGCCENLLVSKKQHESQVTQLQKDLEDVEFQSRIMALELEDLLEERKQNETLFFNLQRSLTRLRDTYRKSEYRKQRSKAIEDRVVEEKDGDDFTKSWVRPPCEAIAADITRLKERFMDMEIHQMLDTTQTQILQNAAIRDAQHEVSTRETKLRYENFSEADTAGGVPIQEHEIAGFSEMERDIYTGMECIEDAFEDLHEQCEYVRYQFRVRMRAQLNRDISPQRKMEENADDTSKERGRAGVPDVELGAQETAEAHSGSRKVHKTAKRSQMLSAEESTRARNRSKYDKLSKDPERELSSGKESVSSLSEKPISKRNSMRRRRRKSKTRE